MKAYIVDAAALRRNLKKLTKLAGSTPVWAVLKGDGYGLGTVPMAALCSDAGVTRFAVTELREARALRVAGFSDAKILMLRPTTDPDELRQLLEMDVVLTVSSASDADILREIAKRRCRPAEVHVKIDTGMGRYGFLPDERSEILSVYADRRSFSVSGIYTHFSSAACDKRRTFRQAKRFQSVLDVVLAAGYAPGEAHCCNSPAFLLYPKLSMGGVRLGSALLGRLCCPGNFALEHVGWCETTVEELRELPKGATCGYGALWRAKRPTRIAVLPVGWYNGFGCGRLCSCAGFFDFLRQARAALRELLFGRNLRVEIGGRSCPVIGRIGAMHTVCDVTDIDVRPGDTAVFDINPLMCKGMDVVYRDGTDGTQMCVVPAHSKMSI